MRIKGQIVWMVDEINIIRLIEPTESQVCARVEATYFENNSVIVRSTKI